MAHTIQYTKENFVERVREITGGKGVPVVYDSLGKNTWEGSLDCLQPFGPMVSFGIAPARGACQYRTTRGEGVTLRHAAGVSYLHGNA
jgi:NADPH:quinone reductase-like Zn-dependent oxidoreductase